MIGEDLARAFVGYGRWFVHEVRDVSLHSYVWLLVGVTATVMLLETIRPWRSTQRTPRETLLGLAYAFMNFFGFGLLGYAALSDVASSRVMALLTQLGLPRLGLVEALALPFGVEVVLYLVVRDLMEYGIHRLLHRVPWLWRIHAVHHATTEMQVLAHLRYHPLETVVYRSLELVPMAMLGFSARDFFVAHAFALLIGHLNHANVRLPLGPLRYVLNSAEMHLLHHAKTLPKSEGRSARGVNFGLTLSLWDYIFGTAWEPKGERRDTPLGFPGVERYPRGMVRELAAPFHDLPAAPTDRQDIRA